METKPIRGSRLDITHRLNRSMVGCWLFNENTGGKVFDLSLNGNHGTINSATWVAGRTGPGLDFDGTEDYLSFGDKFGEGQDRTITAWIKLDIVTQDGGIFTKWTDATGDFLLYFDDVCSRDSATDVIGYAIKNGVDAAAWSWVHSSPVSADSWIHIALVHDWGTSITMYINGISDTAYSQNPTDTTGTGSTADARVGFTDGEGKAFDGTIDEVRIYNRALSATEIAWLYRENYEMFL